jgi:phosphoglycerol transferase MdoB-like AlkP superfamily enzyme
MAVLLKQPIRLFRYFIFWMIYFWLDKIIFLIWNFDQTKHLLFNEIAGIFGYGLKMDISMACYLLLIPCLMLSFHLFLNERFLNRFILTYTIFLLAIASFLAVLDLGLYPHWGTRVNITAFNYFNDMVAMKASVSFVDVLGGLLLGGGLVFLFLFLYNKLFPNGLVCYGKAKWIASLFWLFTLAALIIPIRGGFNTSPMNLSSVAFSPKLYVNQSAGNFMWNFANSVDKWKRFTNPCNYMQKEESERIFEEFMKNDTVMTTRHLIKINKDKLPNVILVILEGFSNKVIAPLGGMNGIAPNLDSLCMKSTLFTSFYASGNRSDRGIAALLGSYPSLLRTSVMQYPEKSHGLTLLQMYFSRNDYNTSFYYGGDINFYNLRSFVLQGNYQRVVSKSDFPPELGRMTKWGVPDGYLFEKAFDDLKTEKMPFMQTIYTVSSHPPYDVPYLKIKGNSVRDKYLNSVSYTDSCLGRFIQTLRNSSLWENTLLIVTSDHGHMQPGPTDITHPDTYRIPLIWSGGVIDFARRIEAITMQSDFATSLVYQLGWKADSSRFSKDFFSVHPFAFYMLDTGWGYIIPEGTFYFDQNVMDFVPKNKWPHERSLFPKAYMQVLHEDFINR